MEQFKVGEVVARRELPNGRRGIIVRMTDDGGFVPVVPLGRPGRL